MLPKLQALVVVLLPSLACGEGLLIHTAQNRFDFSAVHQIRINGRDKLLVLGGRPDAPGRNMPQSGLSATILWDTRSGIGVLYDAPGAVRFAYPDGQGRKDHLPPPQAWREARIEFKRARQNKSFEVLPAATFVAYLPGGVNELANMCMDLQALQHLSGENDVIRLQLELTSAALSAYSSHPGTKRLADFVALSMSRRLDSYNKGVDSHKSLVEGLEFARISQMFFADNETHAQYREQLAHSKHWLDRRIAVLRSLAAGALWDAYIIAFRDFDKHRLSFPDLTKLHQHALETSLAEHWKLGQGRLSRGHYRGAYDAFRLASMRRPSDVEIQKDLAKARTEYTRQAALESRAKRKTLSAGDRELLQQALQFAERFREDKRLDEALKYAAEAEQLDPASLAALLAKARILGERGEIKAALDTLDAFDLNATEEERAPGSKLRNDLLFTLKSRLDNLRKSARAASGYPLHTADPNMLCFGGWA